MEACLIEACAIAAHEANRAYCLLLGDTSQKPWEQAEEWQRESARRGVAVAMEGATPEIQHQAWMDDKIKDGWVWGPVKDAAAKTHPCLVPYNMLPIAQQSKDGLYQSVIRALVLAWGEAKAAS